MRYSRGESSALDAIRDEIRANRRSTLSHLDVAQRAGVSRSTARIAIMKAENAGDLVVTRRNGEPNVVRLPEIG